MKGKDTSGKPSRCERHHSRAFKSIIGPKVELFIYVRTRETLSRQKPENSISTPTAHASLSALGSSRLALKQTFAVESAAPCKAFRDLRARSKCPKFPVHLRVEASRDTKRAGKKLRRTTPLEMFRAVNGAGAVAACLLTFLCAGRRAPSARGGNSVYERPRTGSIYIERLAQYERLVGGGGCGRRRAVRLSDLERVQDLFPHDYLALHDADAPAALATHHAQKTKSLRKRPSLDLGGGVGTKTNTNSPRTFIMEAPTQLCPLGAAGPPLDRHLFLFSDLLLVGKARGASCFKLKESVRVAELWLSMPDGDDTSFLLGWPTAVGVANYLATYPTQAARDTWYRKIQTALNTQLASEPKSTNIQVFFKDPTNSIEFCKTVSVGPELSVRCVVRQALHVLQTSRAEGEAPEGDDSSLGAVGEFVLCMRATRDAPPTALHGIERPHAIQMSRIRQTLSNEDGFDMEHVNAKNNPCGLVFELRKKNQGLKNGTSTPGRGLRLLRRGGRLFGVSLPRLCGGAAPPALLFTLRRLRALAPHTHGVFRRSANAKALRLLRDKLDALGPWAEPCPELERAPVLLLAALVKEFFRALPQPLLSADLYPLWLQALSMPQTEKLNTVRSLLLKLPKANYTMLTYFICLLQAIAKKSNVNLMCPTNLAVCVGPSLLWPLTPCDKAPKAIPSVVELLIVKAEALFGPQIAGLLGNGSPESSNALLDSGAEESDSLHSVGISLDSMELSSPRKEKLSLSRDSGLTLSEDDSNSNGGNSPAPRNILHSLSAPTCVNLQQETKHITRYGTESHNVNGLPPIKQCQNIYANKAEIYSSVNEDLYTAPYRAERYVHNSVNVGITNGASGEERVYGSKQTVQRSQNTYEQSPAKYITGLEPQKPPRSLSKAARTSKVYSMFADSQEVEKNSQNKNFSRAKSSDNLLEAKKDIIDNKRDLVSSQENILYNNIHDLTVFTENLQRQRDQYQHIGVLTNSNYSRVYTGWEKKSANYAAKVEVEKIYGHNNSKQRENHTESENKFTSAATIFTRNDWTRQAARTKSLEANEDNHNNGTETNRQRPPAEGNGSGCRKRRFDPAHLCGKACAQTATDNARTPQMQPSYAYVDSTRNDNDDSKKSRLRNGNGRLNQSKSLANIVVHSDSGSCDTLHQQGSLNGRSSESPASERGYTTQYIEPLYTSVYNRRRDIFHESERPAMFSSDIYKATPTAVQPEYRDESKNDCENRPQHLPPPVPPRKMVYQRILKKFPPVHANKDDKSARSKSVPPVYRDPPTGQVLALDCSDTDTESESYVIESDIVIEGTTTTGVKDKTVIEIDSGPGIRIGNEPRSGVRLKMRSLGMKGEGMHFMSNFPRGQTANDS
ncbi:Rho GTPase-activating protein 20 [Eumeta japonica]|uniref:Rho GTPase-activating protein 20 n=1 Tax=Eumeta variegata TaxID=151549 RepID=A0A4C1UM80_EUMVA|nr:Rho GTPase-activating protein 20 [Eumeta japonica]